MHDLSVLAIHRTIQINNRPTEIGLYFWKQSGDFAWVMSLISTNKTTYESYGLVLGGLGIALEFGLGLIRLLSCV